MLILSRNEMASLLSMSEVIDAVEAAFRAVGSNQAIIPERLHLDLPDRDAVLLEMPSFLSDSRAGALGTKIVSVFLNNAARKIEPIQAVYLLLDPETGQPIAFMDARFITGIRTAATSAVATRLMANKGPKRLLIFGAGTQ